MNKTPVEMLKEFQHAYDMEPDVKLWMKLMGEEAEEVRQAALHLAKELADYVYVTTGAGITADDNVRIQLTANDRLAKEFIRIYNDLFGPEFMLKVLERVHESNMSKLGEDGKPIKRDDGKVQKGPNYKEPDLDDLI